MLIFVHGIDPTAECEACSKVAFGEIGHLIFRTRFNAVDKKTMSRTPLLDKNAINGRALSLGDFCLVVKVFWKTAFRPNGCCLTIRSSRTLQAALFAALRFLVGGVRFSCSVESVFLVMAIV
jgi:hypothetical protein